VRLADDHRPGCAQAAHDLGVARRRRSAGGGAATGRLAGHVDVVLDRDRHAEQRAPVTGPAARVGLIGFDQGPLGEHDTEGVHTAVDPGDAVEGGLRDLARRDLARGDQLGLASGAGVGQVGAVHLTQSPRRPASSTKTSSDRGLASESRLAA
jgi:hypothetical protein